MESKFKTEIAEERALEIVCEPDKAVCDKTVVPEMTVAESSSQSESTGASGQAEDSEVITAESDSGPAPSLPSATETSPSPPSAEPVSFTSSSSIAGCSVGSSLASSHQLSYTGLPGAGRADSRARQLFNALYFSATAALIGATVSYLQLHIIWPVVVFLALAGLLALSFSINNRAHPKDFEVSLSVRTRRLIRVSALLLPIPFLVLFTAKIPANWEYDEGMKLYDNGNYAAAVPHFETALHFNPQLSKAQEMLTNSYFFSDDFQKALASADIALQAFPANSSLLAEKAYVLNLNGKYEQAIPFAQQATQLDPTNGQAFSDLAESNYRLGHFAVALEAANMHVKLHYDEAEAFKSRKDILESLGRDSEAALDAAAAARLEGEPTATDTDTTGEVQQ